MKRHSLGYGKRIASLKIETPVGTVWLSFEPPTAEHERRDPGSLIVDVAPDLGRFADRLPTFGKVFKYDAKGTCRIVVQPERKVR